MKGGDNHLCLGVITTHISPARGFGGPAESIATLVREWQKQGVSLLVCSSRASTQKPITNEDIYYLSEKKDIQLYRTLGSGQWGFGLGALPAVFRTVYKADAVYINGFATFPTTLGAIISVLLGKPFIVASRGGLVENHIDHVRKFRPMKWIFYRALSFPFIRKANSVHVSSQLEKQGVLKVLPNMAVCVSPNGVEVIGNPSSATRTPINNGITYLFLGRISREKGIYRFLKLWLEVSRPQDRFLIAGEGSGAYFESVKDVITKSDGKIVLLGWLDRKETVSEILKAHFIVLPSGIEGMFRENYGNIVAEGLALGTPPIVSDQTIWCKLAGMGIGFAFSKEASSIGNALGAVQMTADDDYKAMQLESIKYAKSNLLVKYCAARILTIFGFGEKIDSKESL